MWENSQRVVYYNRKDNVRLTGTVVDIFFNDTKGKSYDLIIKWDSLGGTHTYRNSDNIMNYLSPHKDLSERNPNRAFKREKRTRR